MSWIFAILLLSVLVFVHELGHLLIGLAVGFKAEAFSIGFGPTIVQKNIKGILFKISLIPFGGYCKFHGENPNEPYDKNNFLKGHPLKKIATYFAGPLFNYIFALILLIILVSMSYKISIYEPVISVFTDGRYMNTKSGVTVGYEYGLRSGDTITSINNTPINSDTDFYEYIQNIDNITKDKNLNISVLRDGENKNIVIPTEDLLKGLSGERALGISFTSGLKIKNINEGSASEYAKLKVGDEIIKINDTPVYNISDLRPIIMDNASMKITLTILRDGNIITREAIPDQVKYGDNTFGSLGVEFENTPIKEEIIEGVSFPKSIYVGFERSIDSLKSYISGLTLLFTGRLSLKENLGGPVRIIQVTSQVVSSDTEYKINSILSFTAMISLILCFMNLLPLPVVDGGMIVISFIELIRRKPIKEEVLIKIQTIGALFLISLAILVTFNDISQLFK